MSDTEFYSSCCFAHVRTSSEEKRKEEANKFDSMCNLCLKYLNKRKSTNKN